MRQKGSFIFVFHSGLLNLFIRKKIHVPWFFSRNLKENETLRNVYIGSTHFCRILIIINRSRNNFDKVCAYTRMSVASFDESFCCMTCRRAKYSSTLSSTADVSGVSSE